MKVVKQHIGLQIVQLTLDIATYTHNPSTIQFQSNVWMTLLCV